jgi:peroxiredoxin
MAATETAYRVVELARELAERHADTEHADWAQSYAIQARLFAQRFPQDSHRAPLTLAIAGEMCERAALVDEARQCYTVLTTTFGDSLASIEGERALRRMNLVGQPIVDFAGETIDGAWLDVAEVEGHTVIVFFKSDSPEFLPQLDELQNWQHVRIVGVSLDSDEAAVREFVESQKFPGTVLFPSDPQLRGESHPLATHYSVRSVPSYWLIDADGRVAGTSVDFEELRAIMVSLPLQ